MNEYDKCIRCDCPVERFTWVKHFGNAWFFGCPKCHLPTQGGMPGIAVIGNIYEEGK